MMFDFIAEKVSGMTDGIYNIKPAPENFQASAGRPNTSYNPWLGTKPAGGKSRRGMNSYAPETVVDHYASRMQARMIDRESIEARTILLANTRYTIGKGLRLDPTPDAQTLGISEEDAEIWGRDFKNRFHLWAKSKGSDVTGRNNFYQNTSFAFRQYDRDNDVFIRFTYSDDPTLLSPVQVGFIDPNQIRGDEFTFTSGPYAQDDGIIKDGNGKETGYKVWTINPNNPGRFKSEDIPAIDEKTGRPLIVHLFKPEYAGQSRGIPKLTAAVQDFQDLTAYNYAALVKMTNEASLNFTSKNTQQDPGDFGFSKLNAVSAGVKIKTETVDTPTPILSAVASCTELPEASLTEPGTNVFEARQGDELVSINSNGPSETAGDYTEKRFDMLSPLLGVGPEIAKMRTNSSFTAAKGAFGMQDDEADINRADIVSDMCDVVAGVFLAEEIAAGRKQAPGFSDPILRAAWLQSRWIAAPPIDLKPSDTAKANLMNASLGLIDLDSAAEQLNSSSGTSNRAKLSRQIPELITDPFGVKALEQADETEIIEEN